VKPKVHQVTKTLLLAVFALPLLQAAAQLPADTSRTSRPTPATKLEAFRPAAGSVMTIGYNPLGRVADVSVDAREIRDSKGSAVRGLVFQVTQSQYRSETSFVDEEELPELLEGIDALIAIAANPTKFKNFQVSYETHGELRLRVFSSSYSTWGSIVLDVTAGRTPIRAVSRDMPISDLKKLKVMVDSGRTILRTLSAR
jgi:hypothetical protein